MGFPTLSRRLGGFALAGVLVLAGLPYGQAQAQSPTDTFCGGVVSPNPPTDFPNRIVGADRYSTAACIMTYQLMQGHVDNTFRGDKPVTRAQTASIVVNFVQRARNETVILPLDYTHSFTDIAGSIHQDRILVAHHLGLFNGVTETEFRPNDPVTREQFATIIVQAMRSVGKVFALVPPAHNFTNIDDSVHKNNIILATHHGWTDVLQAAPLRPVLPGGSTILPTDTFDRFGPVDRYSIANVMAIGGTAAVSEGLWKSPLLAESAAPPAPIEEVCDALCESMRM
jgi:hypothetical protein